MFACIVPGKNICTLQKIENPNCWITEITDLARTTGFAICLLKNDIPKGLGAGIYYSLPIQRKNRTDSQEEQSDLRDLIYIGCVSPTGPSRFFDSPWANNLQSHMTKVHIRVYLEKKEKLDKMKKNERMIVPLKVPEDEINDEIRLLLTEATPKVDEERLHTLYKKFGDALMSWKSNDKHSHRLLHLLVLKGKAAAIEALVSLPGADINIQRDSDRCTPLHLAIWRRNAGMIALLQRLGANTKRQNKYQESCEQLLEKREKMSNLVWMDLELTSLENPEILECAVIITDKDLREIPKSRGHWVIHYEKSKMDTLSSWHQNTFAPPPQGNGLLEDVAKSKVTHKQFEKELLELLKQHCVEGQNSLAGSSVHCDRDVLREQTPIIFKYLSHRIIDVSSLHGLAERWIPNKLSKMSGTGQGNHRAMVDIESSINLLKWHREHFLQDDDVIKDGRVNSWKKDG